MMTFEIKFFVPGNPVPKKRHRTGRINKGKNKGTIIHYADPESQSYEGVIKLFAQNAFGSRVPVVCPIGMDLEIFISIPDSWPQKKRMMAIDGSVLPTKRPDKDNYEKLVCDALNNVIYKDDCQIVDGRTMKRFSMTPGIKVRIYQIEGMCC